MQAREEREQKKRKRYEGASEEAKKNGYRGRWGKKYSFGGAIKEN